MLDRVDVGIALLIINAIFAVGLLIHELARPPRRFRAVTIGLLLVAAIVIAFQWVTDYYFAIPNAEFAAVISVIFAYVSLMALVISSRRWSVLLNRIAGGLGLVLPVLLLVLSSDLRVASIIGIAFGRSTPAFQGRIAPDSSYLISIDQGLFANTHYRYAIFRNPRWLPMVRKQIATGPMHLCRVPAFAAGVKADLSEGEWQVWCRPTQDTIVSAQVSPTSVDAEIPAQIPK